MAAPSLGPLSSQGSGRSPRVGAAVGGTRRRLPVVHEVMKKPADADDDAQYEFKSVRAIRGTEARTIAKWQKAGWELDTQSQGPLLRTEMTFRRVKPKAPWPLLALAA